MKYKTADFRCDDETVCSVCKIQRGVLFTLRGLSEEHLPMNRFVLDFTRLEKSATNIEFSGMDGKNLIWRLRNNEVKLVGKPGSQFEPFKAEHPFGLHKIRTTKHRNETVSIKFTKVFSNIQADSIRSKIYN